MLSNFFKDSFSLNLTPDVPGGLPCSCLSTVYPISSHLITEASVPFHTAAVAKEWFAANTIPLLEYFPFSSEFALADFFLFQKVKEALAGHTIAAEGVKNSWGGM